MCRGRSANPDPDLLGCQEVESQLRETTSKQKPTITLLLWQPLVLLCTSDCLSFSKSI